MKNVKDVRLCWILVQSLFFQYFCLYKSLQVTECQATYLCRYYHPCWSVERWTVWSQFLWPYLQCKYDPYFSMGNCNSKYFYIFCLRHAQIQRGTPPPLENHKWLQVSQEILVLNPLKKQGDSVASRGCPYGLPLLNKLAAKKTLAGPRPLIVFPECVQVRLFVIQYNWLQAKLVQVPEKHKKII